LTFDVYVDVYTKRYVRQQPYHSENEEADISVVFLKEEQLQGRLLYVNNAVRVIYVMLVHCVVQTVAMQHSHINSFYRLGVNCISSVMVGILSSSAVDHGFEPQLGQTRDYKIGISCCNYVPWWKILPLVG
jgi:hypothetical protein